MKDAVPDLENTLKWSTQTINLALKCRELLPNGKSHTNGGPENENRNKITG